MGIRQNSPEKQLLDLIEKPSGPLSVNQAAVKYHRLNLFSLGALKGRISFLRNQWKDIFKEGRIYQIDVKTLNQFLKFCAALLTIVFVVNLGFSVVSLKKDLKLKANFEKWAKEDSGPVPGLLKTATYYVEKARNRDLFNLGTKLPVEVLAANKGPSPRIMEATKDFRLVGIAWSEDPDVMIEDTKNQRTLFLKKGQIFGTDIKLKAVYKDRVVLSYGGEDIELR
jgi:hypothetical protein